VRLEHSFVVDAPPDAVWPFLLDVRRVAPCIPGTESVEQTDEGAFRLAVVVALGPMRLNYRGEVRIADVQEAERRTVMSARAKEARGQGTLNATITTSLAPEGTGTRADIATDLQLTGRAAQMGKGIVVDVSNRLLGEFADSLGRTLASSGAEAPAQARAKPIGGFRLGLGVVWSRLRRLVSPR
jgi:carbon monoxide dehydrogenase subunit G